MKNKEQIQEDIRKILITIESYYDKMVEAICSGNDYIEQLYVDMIDYLEQQRESLELVLN